MISIKTLDGELVQFDGKLMMKSLDADEEPELFYKYFESIEKETGLELYVAVLVYASGKPIWGVASYGEQFSVVMDTDEELTEKDESALLDAFCDSNATELQNLELFVTKFIIPDIVSLCDDLDDNEEHILDVRRMFPDICKAMGFFLAPPLAE